MHQAGCEITDDGVACQRSVERLEERVRHGSLRGAVAAYQEATAQRVETRSWIEERGVLKAGRAIGEEEVACPFDDSRVIATFITRRQPFVRSTFVVQVILPLFVRKRKVVDVSVSEELL